MVTQDIWFVNVVNKFMYVFRPYFILLLQDFIWLFSAVFPQLQSKKMLAGAPSRRLNVAPWCDQRGCQLPTPRFPWRSTRHQIGSRWECPFLHVSLKSTPIILCATADVQGEIPVVLKGFQRCDRSKKCICLIYFTNMLQWRMPLKLFNIASKCSEEQVQRRTNGLRQFEGLTLI